MERHGQIGRQCGFADPALARANRDDARAGLGQLAVGHDRHAHFSDAGSPAQRVFCRSFEPVALQRVKA